MNFRLFIFWCQIVIFCSPFSCGWHCRCDFVCVPLGGAVVKLGGGKFVLFLSPHSVWLLKAAFTKCVHILKPHPSSL